MEGGRFAAVREGEAEGVAELTLVLLLLVPGRENTLLLVVVYGDGLLKISGVVTGIAIAGTGPLTPSWAFIFFLL